jgi:hypothetical protein
LQRETLFLGPAESIPPFLQVKEDWVAWRRWQLGGEVDTQLGSSWATWNKCVMCGVTTGDVEIADEAHHWY